MTLLILDFVNIHFDQSRVSIEKTSGLPPPCSHSSLTCRRYRRHSSQNFISNFDKIFIIYVLIKCKIFLIIISVLFRLSKKDSFLYIVLFLRLQSFKEVSLLVFMKVHFIKCMFHVIQFFLLIEKEFGNTLIQRFLFLQYSLVIRLNKFNYFTLLQESDLRLEEMLP